MPLEGYFVDANLLVLFTVGRVNEDIISKHRRLQAYSVGDFELLVSLVAPTPSLFVTPNTLTEASNLLAQHGEPERSDLLEGLRFLIEESEEIVVASTAAASRSEFPSLGLADAALLEAASVEKPVLTVDLGLYLAAASKAPESAVNFTALRDL